MTWASLFPCPEDAIEIGYEIGRNLRSGGAGKSREKANLGRWARESVASPNFIYWQAGFRAGYRGSPKPEPTFAYSDRAVAQPASRSEGLIKPAMFAGARGVPVDYDRMQRSLCLDRLASK